MSAMDVDNVADADLSETDQYAEIMLDFRDWCEESGYGFKAAVVRATKLFRLGHDTKDRQISLMEIAMGFEVIAMSQRAGGIVPGQASINSNGRLIISAADLINREMGGAKAQVTVLADKLTSRIAVRKSRDGEPSTKFRPNGSKATCWISITNALNMLGKTAEGVKGRYDLQVKDDLLILALR